MRKRDQEKKETGYLAICFKGSCFGVLLSAAILALFAALISGGGVSEESIGTVALCAAVIGSLFGGYRASKRVGGRAILTGACEGLIFFLLLYLIGAAAFMRIRPGQDILLTFAGAAGGGILGGFLSTLKTPRKHKI